MARGYGNGSLDGVERPGRTVDKVDYTEDDDDLEIDEAYFMRTYRPLSNLPTPPPSSRHSAATQSPKSLLEDGESLQACYLGRETPRQHSPRPIPLGRRLSASM